MEGLRFALLFNGNSLERWHVRCLDHLEKLAELTGVMLTAESASLPAGANASALVRFYARSAGSKGTADVAGRLANIRRLGADQPIEPGGLDFVLKLGRGAIPKGIEQTTRHGVWLFQHETEGDLLPFFQEVYDGEDVTAAALLALGGPGSGAAILEQGYFRTEKRSYTGNRDRVLGSIAEWPARVCARLARGDGAPASRAAWPVRTTDKVTRPSQLLRFGTRIARRRLGLAWERLFRHVQWNIGVLRVPVGTLLRSGAYSDGDIEWFPLNNRQRFLADPFGIARNGTIHVLCEDYRYRCGKGHISTLDYSKRGFTMQPEAAIELPVHMSYPFLVEDAGEIYCVPETCYADEVALFRAVEFPHRWSKEAVLVEHFGGVDPTVFRHDGRWWLTCTEKGPDADTQLWVWHAFDLLGPWTPHARNPVKTDVRSARPGGAPFVHEDVLYRPAQDCSKTYGWRIAIQRVKSLTPSEFVEEPVTVLEASAHSPFPLGRHTLTPLGDAVLIDGHRAVFVWHAFRSFLKIWARDWSRKLWRRRSIGAG
jgi:hypothetical protein